MSGRRAVTKRKAIDMVTSAFGIKPKNNDIKTAYDETERK